MKIKLKRGFQYDRYQGTPGQIIEVPAYVGDIAVSIGAATANLDEPLEQKKPAKK